MSVAAAPTSNYLVCEGREVHYMEWGAGSPEVVIAWHGLARTGRRLLRRPGRLDEAKLGQRSDRRVQGRARLAG